MKKQFRLTQSGIDELNEELKELIGQRAPIAERIKQARELGDLAENAEYQTAREEQNRLESRISDIEYVLQNVELIEKPKSGNSVHLGSNVKLKNDGITKEFQVVGTVEADPLNGKISDESPIGKALLGKKVGDEVEIQAPSDVTCFTITEIS